VCKSIRTRGIVEWRRGEEERRRERERVSWEGERDRDCERKKTI
jgi:hypothetical protein